ncbi:hypothetical protein JCM16408A_53720 [Methylobacterium phyllosphaerae]
MGYRQDRRDALGRVDVHNRAPAACQFTQRCVRGLQDEVAIVEIVLQGDDQFELEVREVETRYGRVEPDHVSDPAQEQGYADAECGREQEVARH